MKNAKHAAYAPGEETRLTSTYRDERPPGRDVHAFHQQNQTGRRLMPTLSLPADAQYAPHPAVASVRSGSVLKMRGSPYGHQYATNSANGIVGAPMFQPDWTSMSPTTAGDSGTLRSTSSVAIPIW
eukprot:Selendium_serpulae@DN4207_c1_g1_i1.p2